MDDEEFPQTRGSKAVLLKVELSVQAPPFPHWSLLFRYSSNSFVNFIKLLKAINAILKYQHYVYVGVCEQRYILTPAKKVKKTKAKKLKSTVQTLHSKDLFILPTGH